MNINPQCFSKIIVSPSIELHRLSLPNAFVEEFGSSLLEHANLRTPNGAEHKVDVTRDGGDVWFSEGWKDFVEFHSLKSGHFLVFEYEGNSHFQVLVFDIFGSEIEYPGMNCADDDDVESGEDEDIVAEELNGAKERAMAFRSDNPCFLANMKSTYLSGDYRLWVPASHAKRYMLGEEDNKIQLKLAEPRRRDQTWTVHFTSEPSRHGRVTVVRITKGWKRFAVANSLKVGDACVFELIGETPKTYRVHIFRGQQP